MPRVLRCMQPHHLIILHSTTIHVYRITCTTKRNTRHRDTTRGRRKGIGATVRQRCSSKVVSHEDARGEWYLPKRTAVACALRLNESPPEMDAGTGSHRGLPESVCSPTAGLRGSAYTCLALRTGERWMRRGCDRGRICQCRMLIHIKASARDACQVAASSRRRRPRRKY